MKNMKFTANYSKEYHLDKLLYISPKNVASGVLHAVCKL